MKRFSTGLLLAGAMLGMVSCSNEEGFRPDGPDGKVVLNLSSDGRVMMNTRADDTKVSVIPEASQFGITFEKQDGSFSKNWINVDAFNKESVFPIGTYTISASYGDMEKEGFELPYFYASQDVIVEAGAESHVQLTAKLSNAMVSVRYSEDFTKMFSAYSASLKAESSSEWVVFAQNEDRPAYMKPEKVDMRIALTNAQGNKVEVAPYSFTARPQHHYIVTLGVNDQYGSDDIRLDVQITEEVESEFIDISLGDELFNAPAPALKVYDFPETMTYNEFESFEAPGDPRIDVLAYGGLRKVNVNVTSANPLAFGNSVQLVGADPVVQSQVANSGLEVQGFFRNPDKAGVIKFKDLLSKLPEGTYKFSIDVEDKRTLVSENPVEFTVTIKSVDVKLGVVAHPEYMGREMTISVTTNQPDVKDNIRFEVTNANEAWEKAEILSEPSAVRTRAEGEYVYNYRLSIPTVEHYDIKVRAFYGSDTTPKDEIKDEGVIFPEYRVEADAYANKVLFKVIPADPAKFEIIKKNFKVALNGSEKNLTVINETEGIFECSGLQAATTYDGFESFLSYIDNPLQLVSEFTTENVEIIPNGEFDNVTQTINFTKIQVGGKFTAGVIDYTNQSSIVRSTPDGWANINQLTCWENTSNKNTWFMVPSTFSDNGKVIIQTVGYNHNGTTPSKSGSFTNTSYYCTNTPSQSDLVKVSGELFLGEYSYNGSENRKDGINWTTRPEALTFNYDYESYNGESGEAYISLIDASGAVISTGNLVLANGNGQTGRIVLSNYKFGKKAVKLVVGFKSTKTGTSPAVNIPTGSALSEGKYTLPVTPYIHTVNANMYHAVAVGSKLTIDNVRLEYSSSTQNARNRAKTGKSSKKRK